MPLIKNDVRFVHRDKVAKAKPGAVRHTDARWRGTSTVTDVVQSDRREAKIREIKEQCAQTPKVG